MHFTWHVIKFCSKPLNPVIRRLQPPFLGEGVAINTDPRLPRELIVAWCVTPNTASHSSIAHRHSTSTSSSFYLFLQYTYTSARLLVELSV